MIPSNVNKFPTPLYSSVSEAFDRLWNLVWAKGGTSSWNKLGENDFEVFVQWECYHNKFYIGEIHGDLPIKYRIRAWEGTMELILSDRFYRFYRKQNYGHFSIPGSDYLALGSACYSNRWDDEPVDEFISTPFVNFQGRCRKRWLMTNEAISEVVDFVSDLCDRIELAGGDR